VAVRKLLIFCLILISFNSCADPVATSSGWILYYKKNEYGFERYYRKDLVKPDGLGNLQVTRLTNFAATVCKPLVSSGAKDQSNFCYTSMIFVSKMNCKNRTIQRGSTFYYKDRMAQGEWIKDPYSVNEWRELSREIPEEFELAARICNI